MARLTAEDRRGLRSATFGLPEKRAYPMPDKSHARFAKAMAAKHASPAERKRIDAKADRILGMANGGVIPAIGNGMRRFSDTVGGYWSDDNARFAATNPNFAQRMVRQFNPITGLGSTLGAAYDAARAGDVAGVGLEAAAAIPMFGEAKLAKMWFKGQKPQVLSQGLRGWKQGLGEQMAADRYEQLQGR